MRRPFIIDKNDGSGYLITQKSETRLVGKKLYPRIGIDYLDNNFPVDCVLITIEKESFYVPLRYTGEDGRQFLLKKHGNFNAVYFPLDPQTNSVMSKPDVVFRVPFSTDELTDTCVRTVTLWNQLYTKLYSNKPELATAVLYGPGVLLPYVDFIPDRPSQFHVMAMQWCIYKETGRVYLDALVPENIVIGRDGKLYFLDPGNIINFRGPEADDLEKSIISLEVIPQELSRYVWFLSDHTNSSSWNKIAHFTAALVVLASMRLPLRGDTNLLERDSRGKFLHDNLITDLSRLFFSTDAQVSLPGSNLFLPEAAVNLAARNEIILRLTRQFNLNRNEIGYLRLNPSITLYEKPLRYLSYFNLDREFREEILTCYLLTNERFFYTAAFLLLSPIWTLIKDFNDFNSFYKKHDRDEKISDRYFVALKTLAEKSTDQPDKFYAYRTLRGLSENDAEFLANGYEFGLRKTHLSQILAFQKERQDKIIAVLSRNQGQVTIETVLCASDEWLDEKSHSPAVNEDEGRLLVSQGMFAERRGGDSFRFLDEEVSGMCIIQIPGECITYEEEERLSL